MGKRGGAALSGSRGWGVGAERHPTAVGDSCPSREGTVLHCEKQGHVEKAAGDMEPSRARGGGVLGREEGFGYACVGGWAGGIGHPSKVSVKQGEVTSPLP